jgi:hypothetical protein
MDKHLYGEYNSMKKLRVLMDKLNTINTGLGGDIESGQGKAFFVFNSMNISIRKEKKINRI